MADETHYLYALGRADCEAGRFGPGVDRRFEVELIPAGRVAALCSRVGLDRFPLGKLQAEEADPAWLSDVALRHHRIVAALAQRGPVLPLRMGALFQTRASMLAKIARGEAAAAEFLAWVKDREEWAAKVYLDSERHTERACYTDPSGRPGAAYLAQKRHQQQSRQAAIRGAGRQVRAMEENLGKAADRWCRVRVLPAGLTGRKEKMLWNAAFLVSRSRTDDFLATVEAARGEAASAGLLLELSGPWPSYHFCPKHEF